MRASPAFQISLHRFGIWRGAVYTLASIGMAALAAWLIAHAPAIDAVLVLGLAVTVAVLAWLVLSLTRLPALGLRWDGRQWHLGAPEAPADAAVPGNLTVAIDLGTWMLLRFEPAASAGRVAQSWIPVQRRGIESQWHALRCAVHSPRAAADADPSPGP